MRLLITLMCVISFNTSAMNFPAHCVKKFSLDQLHVLKNSYDYAEPEGMGYTLAAIAWQESSAGNKLVNWSDPSFGAHHILIKTAAVREGFDPDEEPLRALYLAARLVYSHSASASYAMQELNYWKIRRKGNYRDMLASYNAGNNKYAGYAYADKVIAKVKYLQSSGCL